MFLPHLKKAVRGGRWGRRQDTSGAFLLLIFPLVYKGYCVVKKLVGNVNVRIKAFWYTNTNYTQIWYGEFNQYAFKVNLK